MSREHPDQPEPRGLVLKRNVGQSIIIDGRIVVTVIEGGRDRVRLQCHAPPDMTIDRYEIHERRQTQEHPTPTEGGDSP